MTVPTSPTTEGRRRSARAGFTLLELSLTLAILGLIAAIALPRVFPVRSTTDLRIRAYQVAAVLRADRNAAVRRGQPLATAVEAHAVRSGATGGLVTLPDDVTVRVDGAQTAVGFWPDGRTTGGRIVLARGTAAYGVLVDPATGAVTVGETRP